MILFEGKAEANLLQIPNFRLLPNEVESKRLIRIAGDGKLACKYEELSAAKM